MLCFPDQFVSYSRADSTLYSLPTVGVYKLVDSGFLFIHLPFDAFIYLFVHKCLPGPHVPDTVLGVRDLTG